MMSICDLSATELLAKIRTREVGAREAVRAYLDRISAQDAQLGCYLLVDEKGALARAAEIDAEIGRGAAVGPLAGLPIALKDIFVTRGLETTCASKILRGWIPPY